MGKRIYHEIKVIKSKIFAIISMPLENGRQSFKGEYSPEYIEVSSKEEKLLNSQFLITNFLDLQDFDSRRLQVSLGVISIDLMKRTFCFQLAQNHGLIDLGRIVNIFQLSILSAINRMFIQKLRFILEDFVSLLLFSFLQDFLYHFLLDVACYSVGFKVLRHYKIIIFISHVKPFHYIFQNKMMKERHLLTPDNGNTNVNTTAASTSTANVATNNSPNTNTQTGNTQINKTTTPVASTNEPKTNGPIADNSNLNNTTASTPTTVLDKAIPPSIIKNSNPVNETVNQANPNTPVAANPSSLSPPNNPQKAGPTQQDKPSQSGNLQLRTPAQSSNDQNPNQILGIDKSLFINIVIILFVVLIVLYIIYKLYQRKRTREDYNNNPEIFAYVPQLKFNQQYYLNHTNLEPCVPNEDNVPEIQSVNAVNGKAFTVSFKGSGDNSERSVYYHRRQNTTCYLEIEILALNGILEIGFCTVDKLSLIQARESIGLHGISINTAGEVMCEGVRVFKYNITPRYGDVLGIGITSQQKKVMTERRGWVSMNGKLLNQASSDQINKWISTIDISAQEKNNYDLEQKEEQEKDDGKKDAKKQDVEKKKRIQEKQRKEAELLKQKISLKTYNKFQYYPVIRYSNGQGDKNTKIIMNVGGQIFRMNDKKFRSGLLKDKAILFGDNQQHD